MTFSQLIVDSTDGVTTVTVNRPQVLNALNGVCVDELDACFEQLGRDETVRAVVLTGAGDRGFIAGADIAELADLTPASAQAFARRGHRLLDRIERLGRPVIAAVNGFALGGGCEVAMACSIRLAADTAKIGLPEVTLGLIPGFGGTQRLPRLVGPGRALEIMLTGKPVGADDALRLGLVDRVVPSATLMDEAQALARAVASQPARSVEYILTAVRSGLQMSLSDALAHETALFGLVAATEDMREGTRAFLEKRAATFTGR